MIPVGARVGIGAITAALACTAAGIPAVGLLAAGGASAAAVVAARAIARRGVAPGTLAVVLGGLLASASLAGGGGGAVPPPLVPLGSGPWTGRVVSMTAPKDGEQRLTVILDTPDGVVLAVTAPRYPAVEPGHIVRVDGRPREPPEGGYGDFLRRTGVAGTIRSRLLEVVGRDESPTAILERIRRAAGDALARSLPEPAAGLAAGILIGLRDRVDRELAADFTTTGLSHVVAISGWNIALVAGLVGAALAGRPRRKRAVVIVVAIGAYTLLAGASASVVRAAAMAGVALLARETGRPGTAAGALGWAVAGIVVLSPGSATDVGLQLSAAATGGLIAWSAPIGAVLERRAHCLPGWVREGLAVSLAAQAATLPIVLLAFGRLALLSPLLNLVVVPLVPAAMAGGALALVGGAIAALGGPGLVAVLAGVPGAIVLGVLVGVVRAAADLPLASIALDPLAAAVAAGAAFVGVAALAFRGRIGRALRQPGRAGSVRPTPAALAAGGRAVEPAAASRRSGRLVRPTAIVGALAVAVLVVAAAARPDGRAHVVVLDVGQGDAVLVIGPGGGRILVDGGPDPDRLLVALDARFPPWDRRLDLVVLTHPHEDHVAGLPVVLDRYRVARVALAGMPGASPGYEAFAAELTDGVPPATRLATGDRMALDGIDLTVLWPDRERVPASATDDGTVVNDSSVVLLGMFEGRRFLLTGDAEEDVERELVERGLPAVDVLKTGHHGSRTSTSERLVLATRPAVALVSVGAGNDYGHPSPEILERLRAAGAHVLRTDEVGTIDVAIDARGVEVAVERSVQAVAARAGIVRRHARAADATPRSARVVEPAAALPYDRPDARPLSRGRRRPAPRARSARVAPPPRPCRRGGGGVAGMALRRARRASRPRIGRGRRAPPRRGQGDPSG